MADALFKALQVIIGWAPNAIGKSDACASNEQVTSGHVRVVLIGVWCGIA